MSGYYIIPAPKDFLNLSGGTVTGNTLFTQNLSGANIFITNPLTQNDLLDQVVVYNSATNKLEFRNSATIGVVGNFVHLSGDTMTGPLTVPEIFVTGNTTLSGTSIYTKEPSGITEFYELVNFGLLTAYTQSNDTFVTGATFTQTDLEIYQNNGKAPVVTPLGPLSAIGTTFKLVDGLNTYTASTLSGISVNVSAATLSSLEVTGNTSLYTLSAVTITASTIFSGNTSISQIFPYSGTNVGGGQGRVFKQKNNNVLEFNTLSAGTKISINQGTSEILLSTSGVNQYFIQDYAPSAITPTVLYDGDRWFNTLIGTEFVWITDGDSSQWVEPILSFSAVTTGNTITGSGTANRLSKFTSPSTIGDTQTPAYEDGMGIVIGGLSRNTTAIFQLDSTTMGFLPPRLTQTQLNNISNPAVGLLVYQTDGVEGLYIFKSDNTWHLLG